MLKFTTSTHTSAANTHTDQKHYALLYTVSILDKQRICVNTQLNIKKAIKMKCVRTEKQF